MQPVTLHYNGCSTSPLTTCRLLLLLLLLLCVTY
jgi:hypothetical protein